MSDRCWLILSAWWTRSELCAWWGPNESGYTTEIDKAGRYTEEEAKAICANTDRNIAILDEDAMSRSVTGPRVVMLRKLPNAEYQAVMRLQAEMGA